MAKFANILAAPIFSNVREANGASHGAATVDTWSRADALRENHVLAISCDRCQKTGIYYYVHSYTDLEQDICAPCYNELREAATPPAIVAEAKKYWAAAREYAARRQKESYAVACATQPTPGPPRMLTCVTDPPPRAQPVHDRRISRAEVLAVIDEIKEDEQTRKRKRVTKKKAAEKE